MELETDLRTKVGEVVLVFLNNHFRYRGEILRVFDGFLEIADIRSGKIKLISLKQIAEVEYD